MPQPRVILLHGQPGSGAVWRRTLRSLPPGYAIAPDRPGYGANPRPAGDLPANVAWLLGVMDRAGIERAVVAGHSWAGGVAALLAARHPERVEGLLLAGSIGPSCLQWSDYPLAWPAVGPALARAGLQWSAPVLRCWARATGTAVPHSLSRQVWRSFFLEQQALVAQLPQVEAALPAIAAPTIVLAGSADRIVPATTAQRLTGAIDGAQLRIVPGAGHLLPVHSSAAIVRAIATLTGTEQQCEQSSNESPAPTSASTTT